MFGLFGQGNLGNDGSMEAVLGYLRAEHPDVILDVLCTRPDRVTARYGLPARRLHWYTPDSRRSKASAGARAVLGLGPDAFRTASWVRRHDVVIVPGMGVLEATLPLRPWRTPYVMFLLCASGRLFGTRVALVSVGANVIHKRATRRLVTMAATLAHYRSFRDAAAREAMRHMGVDTSGDPVYPDLAFALSAPPGEPAAPGTVGVGVMEYSGGNDDRRQAAEIRGSYLEQMTRFVVWLTDQGRPVRLLAGDTIDEGAVQEVLSGLRARRPRLPAASVVAEPANTLGELMGQLASVDTVVATRYHTVLCAVKLAKPTVAIGYAPKFDALMEEMGLAEYCQSAKSLDASQLAGQFMELEDRADRLRPALAERSAANALLLVQQFAGLSATFFPAGPAGSTTGAGPPAPVPTEAR
jgi:polysaccharide pyruvyl transferase WcaK-like protein